MLTIKPEACPTLRTITAEEIPAACFEPVDPTAREQALVIVKDVKADGVEGLLKHACKLGDLPEGERKYSVSKEELKAAYDASDPELQARCMYGARMRTALCTHLVSAWPQHLMHVYAQALLQRVAARVRKFAEVQRASITEQTTTIEGGAAGQLVVPVASAGCYAPGGRYPLPSSVIMTAVTARTAGVKRVVVASPRPSAVTLAAAYVAGADVLLKVAQPVERAGLAGRHSPPTPASWGGLYRLPAALRTRDDLLRRSGPGGRPWGGREGPAQVADCCGNDSSLTFFYSYFSTLYRLAARTPSRPWRTASARSSRPSTSSAARATSGSLRPRASSAACAASICSPAPARCSS